MLDTPRQWWRPRELALVALVIAFAVFVPSFWDANNLKNLLAQSAPLLLLAIGQTFVLLLGGIDLTQGAVVGFASIAFVLLCNSIGPLNAIALTLAAAFVFGYANGRFIASTRIAPLIATLAGMYILTGVTMLWTGGTPVTKLGPDTLALFHFVETAAFGMIPTMFLIAILFGVAAHVFLARTTTGLRLFAAGSNPKAATAIGIHTGRLHGVAYGLSTVFSTAAAIILTARIEQGNPHLGEGLLFESIGSAVLGGVALSGGVGSAWAAARGVAMLALIQNGLYLTDLNSHVRDIAVGALIIIGTLFAKRSAHSEDT
jgi:ribose transport system permease protein